MPPARRFDIELLKQLIQEHPDWSAQQYSKVLTQDMRDRRNDPDYPLVTPNSIETTISRFRSAWEHEGLKVPYRRRGQYPDMIPWARIPAPHAMDVKLRRLRTLARIRRGWAVNEDDARRALEFQAGLRERRQVVDLNKSGVPILRPARPDELNPDGTLIDIVARVRPEDAMRRAVRALDEIDPEDLARAVTPRPRRTSERAG